MLIKLNSKCRASHVSQTQTVFSRKRKYAVKQQNNFSFVSHLASLLKALSVKLNLNIYLIQVFLEMSKTKYGEISVWPSAGRHVLIYF